MRNLDLFSGIGGFTYAGEKLVGGITTTQFVENNKFCQEILRKHWPDIPIHDDIRTFNAKKYEYDSITAGFPCQDLSVAGRQQGIGEGTRSSLFYEVLRLARQIRPKFILLENVRNLLSHQNGETFQEILFQIAKIGYSAEWSVVSAKDVGACHKRERIWIIAYPKSTRLQRGQWNSEGEGREILSSEQHDRSEIRSEIRRIDGVQSEERDVTNPNSDGSFTTKGIRINEETNRSSQEGENKVSEFERSSESRSSEIVQSTAKWRATRHTLNPNWEQYISKPTICRGDDGLSNRVDRIQALGNSIVPQSAAVPLQRIKDLNEHFSTIT
jgi:DNA (cytosine-5)-methyltransferase 1